MLVKARLALCALGFIAVHAAFAQTAEAYRDRDSVGVFAEYSNDSSHMLMGTAENRRLAGAGFELAHRIYKSHIVDYSWMIEARPVLMEADPVVDVSFVATPAYPLFPDQSLENPEPRSADCSPSSRTMFYMVPGYGIVLDTRTITCHQRWSYMGGASPVGQRLNFRPGKRLQPFWMGNAGFLMATHDIPASDSSWFNFTWETGVGVEWFTSAHRSWSAEVRYHHLSNKDLGNYNPGVDSILYKLTYRFGR